MALTTYAGLSTAIARWLNRNDLVADVPVFIELGDARIRREQQWDRRVYSIEEPSGMPFLVDSWGAELPTGVMIVKDAWPAAQGAPPFGGPGYGPLEQTTFAILRSNAGRNADAAGTPRQYAILPGAGDAAGPRIFLWPYAVDTYLDFLYVHDVGKLTSPENDLFKYAPDVYMFAALAEAMPFLKHDERIETWETKYLSAMASLNAQVERAQYGATTTRAHLPHVLS